MDNKCYDKPILTVLKIDKETEEGLEGAIFELVDNCGNSIKQTTPAYGLIRFPLYNCEKYKLREVKSPQGYECSHRVYEISTDKCGNIFVNGRCSDFITVKNSMISIGLTIRYLANGGTGEYSETDLPYETRHTVKTIEEAGITPPEGLTFVSWNTAIDGSGTSYNPQDIMVLTENVTLYAQWTEVRTVMGLVYPTPFDDLGLGEDFIKGFEIQAELRESFLTPAIESLKTTVNILYPEEMIGRFIFENVALGDYVLCIKLAGRVIRCMNVSITQSSPPIVMLTPPGTLFSLWAGDVNDDLVVDSSDIEIIEALDGVRYGESDYIFKADLNFDGIIDDADVSLATANLGKTASDYPGAEDVDFNS